MTLTAAQPVTDRLAGFAALLREHGMRIGPAEQQAMLQSLLILGGLQARALEAAWRAVACGNARDWRLWPELFQRFWYPHRVRGTVKVSGQTRPRKDLRQAVADLQAPADATQQPPAPAAAAGAGGSADSAGLGDTARGTDTPRAMGGASRTDALLDRSAQQWLPDDLLRLQGLARRIHHRLRPRPTRRWQRLAQGPRLDLRHTLRRSVAHGGVPLAPAWQQRRTRPPQLFILVDVSRSMEAHAAFFLRVARAFAQVAQARVFVFHVQLAEVTALMQRDSAVVQEKINAVTAGFGAGTRIAANLHTFARRHARAQLGADSRLWIFSDGYDTDAPEDLASELQVLRGHGARLTWFHPTRQAPASQALGHARHCVERFLPLATLADLQRAETCLR
jgi:uncharacterized protein